MTIDPREGVDHRGLIRTGASRRRVGKVYAPILTEAASAIVRTGAPVVSIYVYGSVATGQARPPESDVDLLAVLREPVHGEIESLVREVSKRWTRIAREVSISLAPYQALFDVGVAGMGWRCFIKHYCVLLWGKDLAAELRPCRATPEVAWSFNPDLDVFLDRIGGELASAGDQVQVTAVGRRLARKTLLAAGSLASAVAGTWTTDRSRAVEIMVKAYPLHAADARLALGWAEGATPQAEDVSRVLHGFAAWVGSELKARCQP